MSHARTYINRIVGTEGVEDDAVNTTTARETTEQIFDVPLSLALAADAGATNNTANTKVWTNPFNHSVQIVSAVVNSTANVAADATNFATIELLTQDAAGGTPVVGASIATNATGFTAGVSRAMTLTAANCTIVAGGNLFRKVTKSGAGGVAVTEHTETLRLRRQ